MKEFADSDQVGKVKGLCHFTHDRRESQGTSCFFTSPATGTVLKKQAIVHRLRQRPIALNEKPGGGAGFFRRRYFVSYGV